MNTFCEQNVGIFYTKTYGTYGYHGALKVQINRQ
jgi:hypothetical protein